MPELSKPLAVPTPNFIKFLNELVVESSKKKKGRK